MNEIKIKVNFGKRTCVKSGINLTTGDYNSTKIKFEFDREDGIKIFEMKNPNDEVIFVDEIVNNEVILVGSADVTTKNNNITYIKYTDDNDIVYWYDSESEKLYNNEFVEVQNGSIDELTKVTENASLFTMAGRYVFEISLYDGDSKLTSKSDFLDVKEEQVIINNNMVSLYLPVFDRLIGELDNLDIDVSKSGSTSTVILTKKDGTNKTIEINDGKDGIDGVNGVDGISPTATVTQTSTGATITITDKNGTTTANIVNGGPGGTNNYDDLNNKPSINDVELSGNKTSSDLGLQPAGNYVSDNNYVHTDNNYTSQEKQKLAGLSNYDDAEIKQSIANKVDKVTGKDLSTNDFTSTYKDNVDSNTTARHTHTNKQVLDNITDTDINNWNNKSNFSGNYNDLTNKPTIITKSVNDLLNYYLKTETYTKNEVNTLIGQIVTVSIQVVQELPQIGQANIIYFVPKTGTTNDVYNEYIYVNNAYELIGSTQVDLTGYATESWVNTQISNFLTQLQIETLISNSLVEYAKTQDIPTEISELTEDSTHRTVTDAEKISWNNKSDFSGNYNDLTNKPTIPTEVTESTVSNWGFTKNTGTYSKPVAGIPKTDLESAVQTSLGKADTALQSYTEQYIGTLTGITMNGVSKGTSGVVDLGTVITTHQDISGKLDTSKVKNANSTTAGDVYDVRYINTMLGDIETLLGGI